MGNCQSKMGNCINNEEKIYDSNDTSNNDQKDNNDDQQIKNAIEMTELKQKIEEDGIQKIYSINTNEEILDQLINIMKNGNEEFKQKTGRNMSYSEMREMYG